MIPDLGAIPWTGRAVTIAFDSDVADKQDVQWAEWHLAEVLRKSGANVSVVRLPSGPVPADGKPAKAGLDDYLVAHGPETFRELLKTAAPPLKPKRQCRPDGRRVIVVQPEEHKVIAEVIESLADADRDIYQRGGQLVRTVREPRPGDKEGPGQTALRITPLPLPDLRTRITSAVQLAELTKDGTEPIHPPNWLAPGVAAAGRWPKIRPLEAISPTPVLRRDGTILQSPGYDAATGVLYEPRGEYPVVSDVLSQADAAAAASELCEVICDFPFEAPEHRAAWVAGLLTPFARFAYFGPAPLFLIDANVRAAGKSILADVAANIAAETDFARRSYPTGRDRADEMRKVITALAVAGERLVLLDNLPTFFGDCSLDAALTATEWSDRILGHTQTVRVPLLMTWWATGNNVTTEGDTSRRVLPIRLLSADEHPEQREGFRHPDLLAWVRRERGRLVKTALTILAAYIRAGRPDQKLKPWGSFEGWSGLVRAAVVWAGLPDPRAACSEFVSRADTEAAALGAMLAAWPSIDPDGAGLTLGKLLRKLKEGPTDYIRLREALAEFCPTRSGEPPDTSKLGARLRRVRRRNVGGRCFDNRPAGGGTAAWFVAEATPAGDGRGGDGGHGGYSAGGPSRDAHARAHASPTTTSPSSPPSPPMPDPDPDSDGHGDAWEPPASRLPGFSALDDGPYSEGL
jgi:hypothetical protein